MGQANAGPYPRSEPIVFVVGVVLVGAYMLLHMVVGTDGWPWVARLAVGLLPAAAIVTAIAVELRVIRRLDEMQQRIQLEAFAVGYPGAIVVIVAVRFLQAEGVLAGWQLGDVWPFLLVPYFVGLILARRRYK